MLFRVCQKCLRGSNGTGMSVSVIFRGFSKGLREFQEVSVVFLGASGGFVRSQGCCQDIQWISGDPSGVSGERVSGGVSR